MSRSPARFKGGLNQLQTIVELLNIPGRWEFMQAEYWRYRCEDGAILNWWPSTGTLNLQGPPAAARDFEHALRRAVERQRGLEGPR